MKTCFNLVKSIFFAFICVFSFSTLAQSPTLIHSYTFENDQATDEVSGADGTVIGGKFEDGMYVTKEQGQYISLPADKIKINTFNTLTLEAYIVADQENPKMTMLSYFGNSLGLIGTDYIFQSVANLGQSRFAISTSGSNEPWTVDNAINCNQLYDGKRHHIVSTFDNNELKFFIDGYLVGTQTNADHPENRIANIGTSHAYIGKSGYYHDYTWLGKIDEFNIYEGIMSDEEVLMRAQDYIPDLDLSEVEKGLAYTDLVVDDTGTFDQPISGDQVIFTEIMPNETDGDRRVNQMLVFSDGDVKDWSDISTMIGIDMLTGYLKVSNGFTESYAEETKVPGDIGHIYQCWVVLDVANNSYSVYAKTLEMEEPTVIYENAEFRKGVDAITNWSLIHNKTTEGALVMNRLSSVDLVGAYPPDYSPSEEQVFTIANAEIPANATEIDNPRTGIQRGEMQLKKVVLTDSTTELFFHTPYRPRWWINISKDTYIKSVDSGEKLTVKGSEGITLGARHHTPSYGYNEYKLIFPAVEKGTSRIDYESDGSWSIYDIQLASSDNSGLLSGHWFNTNTGDWELDLIDNLAIYDSKVWAYNQPLFHENKGTITLTSGDEKINLIYKLKNEKLAVGPSKKAMVTLVHDADYQNVANPSNPSKFELPLFRLDTATLSGYIHGFRAQAGNSTATIYVDNVLTGQQENHILKVNKNGTFQVNIPMIYPQSVYLRNDFGIASSLFLEPGEETFVMVDLMNGGKNLVMGKNARLIAEELLYLEDFAIRRIHVQYRNSILRWSPEDFKTFCLTKQAEDLELLERMKNKVSDRFYQVKSQELTYSYLRDILHYHYTLDGAKRQANQDASGRTELPADPSFYTFLNDEIINSEMALLANSFENFMNAFMFSPVVRTQNFRYSIFDLVEDAKGLTDLSEDQMKLINNFQDASVGVAELDEAFNRIYGKIQNATIQKYNTQFQEFLKDTTSNESPILRLINYLSESDSLSNDEVRFIKGAKSHYAKENVKSYLAFMQKHQAQMNEIFQAASTLHQSSFIQSQIQKMEEQLGIHEGLASDIIYSQNYLRKIVSEMTPMNDASLTAVQDQIQSPFISSYIEKANQATIAKVEANKNAGGYTDNDVPETEADKVFDAIVSNYKGKVIYVDFWATWCGPCLSSMKNQKSMKESLMKEEKDIVFVYITNPSSPENTYKNMIPNIKGEHYRVSQDEWNHIGAKFNISGIPHYAIVNKKGEVVDGDASREPTVLMKKFEELMAEEY